MKKADNFNEFLIFGGIFNSSKLEIWNSGFLGHESATQRTNAHGHCDITVFQLRRWRGARCAAAVHMDILYHVTLRLIDRRITEYYFTVHTNHSELWSHRLAPTRTDSHRLARRATRTRTSHTQHYYRRPSWSDGPAAQGWVLKF